jgi:hypothetical protein
MHHSLSDADWFPILTLEHTLMAAGRTNWDAASILAATSCQELVSAAGLQQHQGRRSSDGRGYHPRCEWLASLECVQCYCDHYRYGQQMNVCYDPGCCQEHEYDPLPHLTVSQQPAPWCIGIIKSCLQHRLTRNRRTVCRPFQRQQQPRTQQGHRWYLDGHVHAGTAGAAGIQPQSS